MHTYTIKAKVIYRVRTDADRDKVKDAVRDLLGNLDVLKRFRKVSNAQIVLV